MEGEFSGEAELCSCLRQAWARVSALPPAGGAWPARLLPLPGGGWTLAAPPILPALALCLAGFLRQALVKRNTGVSDRWQLPGCVSQAKEGASTSVGTVRALCLAACPWSSANALV